MFSAFVHQIKIGEIQLMPMGRVKRETGILVPEDEADDEGSLSGLTNFQLVVYNPEELQETDGTLETGTVEQVNWYTGNGTGTLETSKV